MVAPEWWRAIARRRATTHPGSLMRYLVTGASGFVGRALTRHLLDAGIQVHALVRDPTQAEAADRTEGTTTLTGATLFRGSVADPNEIAAAAERCDVVVHTAAVTTHRASRRVLGWVNVAGTENVLAAARHAGCKRLVHLSCTDVTLHTRPRNGWNEDMALSHPPLNAMAATKLEAEERVIGAGDETLETIALRPALVWGPGDTTTLPHLYREALDGGITMVGTGDNLVASTYIDNLVRAIVAAANATDAAGGVYHVTDGEMTLAHELYGGFAEVAALPVPKPGPRYRMAFALAWARQRFDKPGLWPADVAHRGQTATFDQKRALADLDWEPSTRIADGMEALRAWVAQVGGAEKVAAMARVVPSEDTIDAQVRVADAAAS